MMYFIVIQIIENKIRDRIRIQLEQLIWCLLSIIEQNLTVIVSTIRK